MSAAPAPAPFGPHFGFGLYVHWPYCARICPYCDFNVFAAKDRDSGPLVGAIAADIRAHRPRMPGHGALDSVYFGGGTPALLRPDEFGTILLSAAETFGIKRGAEITLEANPNDVLRADLIGLQRAGVTRLSIGVQSLRDASLAFLGRDHDAASAALAVSRALKVFPSVSIDLIYARPGQTPASWEMELKDALALGAPHLSLYELTFEAKTPFGLAARRGDIVPMGDDAQADLYELTQDVTQAAGMPAYEVSNHAASPAHQSRHNLIYWRGGDWIGVGPGAHGRISVGGGRYASEAERRPEAYMANVQALQNGWGGAARLEPLEIARELLAMGLRAGEGIDLRRIEAVAGAPVARDKIDVFIDKGWAGISGAELRLTPAGRLLADAITAALSP
ncbi:MAG: radical SAM family heme chaperone HemW [Hyphomonas sp.]|uniref:radical SAM family heme chaperone HemW n=1 Tax=Hyphomonas sp. TaxID=87 RepID=UPI0017BCC652|nr:radical SAM family heme chaperone HemW [Hyphomonas sp.]MBA3068885.1 radical SAM family heme chaperone HemW [Hyphomonas sp.]MBU4062903.1 radical SAM family heme chaperone HemW [Alphaproteobacteria bacterium]MBU4165435.1 radical SAM family heme chaperone HemW [Alphaproteobacteria bacterium]MBU4568002.1 radical SAM family heme chaperone HemW [Alphaproteobacteria bacterium]